MQRPRKIVETITESILVVVLIGIIVFAFAVVADLTPKTESHQVDAVLGAEVSRIPFEYYQENNYEQTKFLGSDNGFSADYSFAVSHTIPVNEYKLLRLNNSGAEAGKFRVMIDAKADDLKLVGIYVKIDDKEEKIYDITEDAQLYDLVLTLDPETTKDLIVVIKSYSEEVANEISLTVTLEKLI